MLHVFGGIVVGVLQSDRVSIDINGASFRGQKDNGLAALLAVASTRISHT